MGGRRALVEQLVDIALDFGVRAVALSDVRRAFRLAEVHRDLVEQAGVITTRITIIFGSRAKSSGSQIARAKARSGSIFLGHTVQQCRTFTVRRKLRMMGDSFRKFVDKLFVNVLISPVQLLFAGLLGVSEINILPRGLPLIKHLIQD